MRLSRAGSAVAAALLAAALLHHPLSALQLPPGDVEVDVVAVDSGGRPIDDLRETDFSVREDGAPVAVTSFFSSAAHGQDEAGRGRSIVMLLDDSAVPPQLTSRVQQIARGVMSRAGASDSVSVMRFSQSRDEPGANRDESMTRIAEYRGGARPFFGRATVQDALTRIAVAARGFDPDDTSRHAIVVIGAPGVFDVDEPFDRDASLIWPYWTRALAATAHARASVYVIDPSGLRGRLRLDRNGIVARTGGASFYNRNDFSSAVQQIWQDTGHYYLLAYKPGPSKRRLHDIKVTVSRPAVKVRARRTRVD